MIENQQYTCPICDRIGAHPINCKPPLCDKCHARGFKTIMKPSNNGRILTKEELPIFTKRGYLEAQDRLI